MSQGESHSALNWVPEGKCALRGGCSTASCSLGGVTLPASHDSLDARRHFPLSVDKEFPDLLRPPGSYPTECAACEKPDHSVVIFKSLYELIHETQRMDRQISTDPTQRVNQRPADICGIVGKAFPEALQDTNQPAGVSLRQPRKRCCRTPANDTVPVVKHTDQFRKSSWMIHDGPHDFRGSKL